jgi:hypothetical protein
MSEKEKPTPGSDEAIQIGCTCPVMDNAHGQGAYGQPDTFWVSVDCPVHGTKKEKKSD